MASFVERINHAFETATPAIDQKVFANRVGGSLIINALGTSIIDATPKPYFTLPLSGAASQKIIADAVETPVAAADLQLLTREGRQVAGALTPDSSILTSSNGFSSNASLTSVAAYRNLSIKTTTSPLVVDVGSSGRSATLAIDVNSTTDGAWTSATNGSSITAGSVYSLGIAGLPAIRLAGDTIAGKDSTAIAETFEKRLNALAPSRLVIGQATTLSDALQSAQFTITIDNKDYNVIFNRSLQADGTPLPGGTFQVAGNPDLKIDMVPATSDPTKQQVIISLPKKLGSDAPSLKIAGDDASLFGLGNTSTLRQILIATQPTSISEADAQTSLQSKFGLSGTTITKVDGRLVVELALSSVATTAQSLASLSSTYAGATAKMILRDEAVSLGFLGTDLTISRNETNFSISSLASDDSSALLDTSATVSRIAQKISVSTNNETDPIPEDLIVSVKGSVTGQRKILTDLPPTMVRSNPIFPDVEMEIVTAGKIEIFDRIKNEDGTISRGASLGIRNYSSGKPVTFLGATFQLDGNAAVGDTYTIITDSNRIGDNRNGLALAQLQHRDMLGPGSGTFQEIYQDEIGKIGASSQAAQTSASSLETVAQNLKTAFDEATGVNLDSEAADLIKLQQAYSACAQIVSTARDMFNTILNAF
jgi:flagellar hook-associated protein FlgK